MLFKFNFSAYFFECFLQRFSIGFSQTFFDGAGCAINEIFSLFQTKTSLFFHSFNDCEFVSTGTFQYNIERGFFLSSSCTSSGGSGNSNSCSSGFNAILLFEDLCQLVYFFYGQVY